MKMQKTKRQKKIIKTKEQKKQKKMLKIWKKINGCYILYENILWLVKYQTKKQVCLNSAIFSLTFPSATIITSDLSDSFKNASR